MSDIEKTMDYTFILPGIDILHFHIIEKIGAGGMGEVYLADDAKLHRRVALKFLAVGLTLDQEHIARFLREAQAAARLNHPNIVVIYEVNEYRGRPFFAMELLVGTPLQTLAAQGAVDIDEVAAMARQIAEGLAHAHGLGVFHRDIKGGNIFVTREGRVKILDFGLASLAGSERLTQIGSSMGTLSYMSPEQIQGHEVDQRADLFSFGVVLYELLTGKLPFQRANSAATMQAILTESPEPVNRYRPGVSDDWQWIIDKSLQKDRSTRYQTAADMLADLKRVGQSSSIIVKTAERRSVLAVLPFENVGPAEQEYFADGITDEITSRLAKLHEVTVISNSSAQQYKKSDKRLKQIGQELGACYLVQGTVRWDKSAAIPRVHINARLVRVDDESYLWAETYDRALEQIFVVQSELAGKVADALDVTLVGKTTISHATPATATGGTTNIEAYDHYLKALNIYPVNYGDFVEAIALYQQAINLDSTYAAAYARMARAEIAVFHTFGNKIYLEQARKHIDEAFQLAPGLLEAHLALGYWYYQGKRDYDHAVEQFQIITSAQPNHVDALLGLSLVHRRQNLFDQSIEEAKRLIILDPRNNLIPNQIALSYLVTKRFDEALKYIDRAIILKDHGDNYEVKALIVTYLHNDLQAGIAVYREAMGRVAPSSMLTIWQDIYFLLGVLDQDPARVLSTMVSDEMDSTLYLLFKAYLYGLMGKQELKDATLETLVTLLEKTAYEQPDAPQTASYLGFAYALSGSRGKAISWARKAVALRTISLDAMEGCVWLENLAYACIFVGEYDQAIDTLKQLVDIPSYVNRQALTTVPVYEPLRSHPRFRELMAG